jgi:DNA end-binding protein Ku
MRALWKGSLSFGLVNIPIKLYSAIEEKVISFRELCPRCHSPLQHRKWCPNCKREIAWAEIERGYRIAKDRYVILSKEELDAVKLKTTKAVEIVMFVDRAGLDPIFFEKHYFLAPQEGGERAYCLLKEILDLTGKAAIGKVVIRNKEYLVAILGYKNGLLMTTLHYAYEIRDISQLEELKVRVELKEEEKKLAKALIDELSAELDIKQFKDEYAEALKSLIKQKLAGKEIRVAAKERIEKAKSLMEALKVSVEAAKRKRDEKI